MNQPIWRQCVARFGAQRSGLRLRNRSPWWLACLVFTAAAALISHAAPPANIVSTPLAPRPADGPKGTLFESLPPETTGIDFINRGGPQRTDAQGRIIFFATSSGKDTAGGVAIGDYDGDGLEDIFLTRAEGGDRLFKNLGGFRFRDVTAEAHVGGGGRWSTGCSFVDIDNDGDLDLAVCGYACPNAIYLNNGDGTFTESAAALGLDFNGASIMLAFADYDRDGDLDAFLLTNFLERPDDAEPVKMKANAATGEVIAPPERAESVGGALLPDGTLKTFRSGQADRLYRNDGGKFIEVSDAAGIRGYETGLSVTWWDYNRDGWPDLYVANDFYGQDRLFRNNRDGTFTDVIRDAIGHTPWYSMGTDAADINNDGLPDLMATDMAGTNHYKDKIGMGDMSESAWFLTHAEPRQFMRNALYLNSGTPRFMEIAYMAGVASTDWTWSVNFGDLDNDGLTDLFVTNGMTRDLFNSDLKREEAAIMAAGDRERAARFWAEKPPKKDANIAFKNTNGLQFSKVGEPWGLDHLGVSFGSAEADLDNDGDLDVVVNNYGEPASIFRNRSAASHHAIEVRLAGRASNRAGIGATVEVETDAAIQMRFVTLARGYMSSPGARVHVGLGAHERVKTLAVTWPGGREQRFTDLPADRLYTLTEPESDDPVPEASEPSSPLFARAPILQDAWPKERPFDDFARQPLLPNKLSQLGPGMAWADIDGDGRDDLFLGGPAGASARLYRQTAEGFVPADSSAFADADASEDMAPLFFDADGDGDADLYVASGGVEGEPGDAVFRDRLYLNDGRGAFSPAPPDALPDVRESSGVVAAADFDRDGDLDLFIGGRSIPGRYPETPRSHLLVNDGAGKLTDGAAQASPALRESGMVTSALWSDADGDGWLDLLVTHEWGPVKLFRNRAGKSLEDATAAAGLDAWTGWWNGIAGRDLDGDGDIDYVVTNIGLNTKYHATPEAPELLYYADFDGTGRREVVEAAVKDGTTYPRRGFSCSSTAMPFLKDKLKTFHNFASATLDQIYAPDILKSGVRLAANTLESGVLLNDGRGRFTFRPLPALAQISPGFGVALADFDGDGKSDCVIAQNFFNPQPETGRMDNGLSVFLKGRGDGAFDPVMAAGSGLVISGDARSLAIPDLDGDGRPDLVFGVNDGPVRVFLNRATGDRTFALRLAGPVGNPAAIGARVTVEAPGLPPQTAEISAGGGCLSQQPAILFFGLGKGADAKLQIVIRWPDGHRTTHQPAAPAAGVLTLRDPTDRAPGGAARAASRAVGRRK